jgi:hypothetical protein
VLVRSRGSSIGVGVAVLVTALVGCYSEPGGPAVHVCRDVETPLADDATPAPRLGFGASALAEWVFGAREGVARFLPPPDGVGSDVPPSDVGLRFTLDRGDGPARQVERDPACGGSAELQVPATLAITTDGGELDERVAATVLAQRVDFARVEAPLELLALSGSWSPSFDQELRRVRAGLLLSLAPQAHGGRLTVGFERWTEDAVSLGPGGVLMRWPAEERCQPFEVERALAADDPEWLAPMASLRSTEWSSPAGTDPARSATLSLEPVGVECEPPDGRRHAPFLAVLRVDDGSELQLALVLRGADGGGLELGLDPRARATDRADAFAARFSDFGLDFTGLWSVRLELTLGLTIAGAAGVITVVGAEDTCEPVCDGPSCFTCRPYPERTLLELRFVP